MNYHRHGKPARLPDLRTDIEKAIWDQIRTELAQKRRKNRLQLPDETLPDVWHYSSEHLLAELDGVRELILRVPETLQNRSAIQTVLDRIWRLEEDIRYVLQLHRDGQHAFAKKAAAQAKKAKAKIPADAGDAKIVRIRA